MSSLGNPEASVRKNINIKFNNSNKNEPFSGEFTAVPQESYSNNVRRYKDEDSSRNSSRSRSRSRSSTSSSHSSSRSRSRSRSSLSRSRSSYYSSSQYSESPHKSPYKRPVNGPLMNGNGQAGQQIVDWNFSLNFCGEATKDPTIFICDMCHLPVVNYGRLLPCKHIFCYQCALEMNNSDSKQSCTKCRNSITNIELCPPGQLFVCTYGGSKIRGGCRRAYKTSEDLQTHANQRHNGSYGVPQNSETQQLEPASVCLASIQVHQGVPQSAAAAAALAAANLVQGGLPPALLNPAQLPPNIFHSQPRGNVPGPNPFVNPMMAQAALFLQAQQAAAAQPFMFRGGPGGLIMGPPPLVFAASSSASGAQAPSQPGSGNSSQNS